MKVFTTLHFGRARISVSNLYKESTFLLALLKWHYLLRLCKLMQGHKNAIQSVESIPKEILVIGKRWWIDRNMKPLGLKSRIVGLPLAILVAVFHGSTDIHLRTRRGTRETSDPTMKKRRPFSLASEYICSI